jgi:septum formation protein
MSRLPGFRPAASYAARRRGDGSWHLPTARDLILASTSESRRSLLEGAGIPFRVEKPDFNEAHPEGVRPSDLAEALALGKARSVALRFPDALVIGADQVLSCEGQSLRKPKTEEAAREQLRSLNGKSHLLVTGLAVLCESTHELRVAHDVARLTMRFLGDEEIDRYLATGEWQDCLGAYRVEGAGIKLFQQIEGDLNAIRGLPLVRLCNALRDFRVPLFA